MEQLRVPHTFKCMKIECSHLSFSTFKRYLIHARNYHIHEPNFKIRCPVGSCFRSYVLISSLTSHIRRKHGGEINGENFLDNQLDDSCDNQQNENENGVFDGLQPLPFPEGQEEPDDCVGQGGISVKKMALFALKTQEFNRLSDIATDTVLENTQQLLEQNQSHLKKQVEKCIKNAGIDLKNIEGLEDLLGPQQDVPEFAKKLRTSKDRNKYLRDTLNMVVCIVLFDIRHI